jgi:glutaconate CoA-transferase subunit A
MSDKRMTEADAVAHIESGMTIGIGGWGSRRKPMSMVRELLRSDVTDLRVVSYGGPDVGLLCAAGKVRSVVFSFVSLDSIPLEPHFRKAREGGHVTAEQYDEGMMVLGLQAAAWRVPYLPTRVGLGSDVLTLNPGLATVDCPYTGEPLVAMPALELDVALLHLNRADARGNAAYDGPDLYFDHLYAAAATQTFVSTERVVEDISADGCIHTVRIPRLHVAGVVERPNAAHFTSCQPDYERDERFQSQYAASAAGPDEWAAFRAGWIDLDEAEYQQKVTR